MKTRKLSRSIASIVAAFTLTMQCCALMPITSVYAADRDEAIAYNKQVDEYNARVDADYDKAAEEVSKANSEGMAAQAESQRAHDEAVAKNEAAVQDAEKRNSEIDAENAAQREEVEAHNAAEDARSEASVQAKADAEAANAELAARYEADIEAADAEYEEAVRKYNEDLVQYEADLKQYESDKAMEERIKAIGYESVTQYNQLIETNYNNPARNSVEKNQSAGTFDITETYTIEKAVEASGNIVKAIITHVFEGYDEFTVTVEMDANDAITLKSAAAVKESTLPGYATLYLTSDDEHTMGYWCSAGSMFQYSVKDSSDYEWGWENGDTHKITLRSGTKYAGDDSTIYMTYNYFWIQQKIYKTYNEPTAPAAPEAPVRRAVTAPEYVEVPEIYTPSYRTYTPADHIASELVSIPEVIAWTMIEEPVRAAYMEYMKVPAAGGGNTAVTSGAAASASITDSQIPMADAAEVSVIEDSHTPLAANGSWALINLISAILTVILGAVTIITRKRNDEDDSEEDEKDSSRRRRLIAGLLAAISAAAFILTEDMSLMMTLTDGWTILMIIILAAQTVGTIISSRSSNNDTDINESYAF